LCVHAALVPPIRQNAIPPSVPQNAPSCFALCKPKWDPLPRLRLLAVKPVLLHYQPPSHPPLLNGELRPCIDPTWPNPLSSLVPLHPPVDDQMSPHFQVPSRLPLSMFQLQE